MMPLFHWQKFMRLITTTVNPRVLSRNMGMATIQVKKMIIVVPDRPSSIIRWFKA
jgi:hypothetical protein